MIGIALSIVGGIWVATRGWIPLEHAFFLALYLSLLSCAFIRSRIATPLIFLTIAAVATCRFLLVGAAVSDVSVARQEPLLPRLGVEVEGKVLGVPEYRPLPSENLGAWRFRLRCAAINDSGVRKKVRGEIDVRIVGVDREALIISGQRIRVRGQLHRKEFHGGNALELKAIDPADYDILAEPGRLSPTVWVASLRQAAARRLEAGIEGLPLQQAVLKALVLGYRSEMPPDTMDVFRRTGALHIFAISGLHVGIVGLLLVIVLKTVGIPRDWFGPCLLPLLLIYIVATGMKASALRALVMAGVFLMAPLLRRKPDIPSSVAFAAIVLLLLDPRELLSAGFVYSFVVVVFIVMVYSATPAFLTAGGWVRSYGASLAITSFAACLASIPLTALYFGRFSPIALLGNLVVVPLTFCIVLSGWLSVLIPFASPVFNHAAVVFINLMLHGVTWLDRLPGSSWQVDSPPLLSVGLWYCCLVYFFVHATGRRQRACAIAGAGAAMLWAILA